MADNYEITRIGGKGDGIAIVNGHPVFVAGTAPGDVVSGPIADGRIASPVIISRSKAYMTPPCADFGRCGGCTVQQLSAHDYASWKRGLVIEALAREGIETSVDDLRPCQPASRRRAKFSVKNTADGVLIGFQAARSNEIIAFEQCHVIEPVLNKARGALKALARTMLPFMGPKQSPAAMLVTVARNGLDVAVTSETKLSEDARKGAMGLAVKANLARLTFNGEIIIEQRRPVLVFDGIATTLPIDGFAQAVPATEKAMVAHVVDFLKPARHIADLFSGAGTFSLPLLKSGTVAAFEQEGSALNALDQAWREQTGAGLKSLETQRRNLFERPVTSKELDVFDGLVFDPPRAGAEAQAKHIAAAPIARVAAVSCNPATLARDLRILVDGGYTLKSVTPFDQFLWSAHVEVIALLEKPRAPKAKHPAW